MKIKLNHMFRRVQGMMDDVVYRRSRTGIVSAIKPDQTDRPPTTAQLRVQDRFSEAVSYATAVVADPAQSAAYQAAASAQDRALRTVIMADYLNPPVVHEIDLAVYKGRVGDLIRIRASDDFEVVTVKVRIKNAAGDVIEEGLATKGATRWIYSGRIVVPTDQNLLIEAEAADRAGNERALSESWHA